MVVSAGLYSYRQVFTPPAMGPTCSQEQTIQDKQMFKLKWKQKKGTAMIKHFYEL
jgi:hypothetical protein